MASSYDITVDEDIQPSATRFDITDSSEPNDVQVAAFIDGREAELHRYLKAQDITYPLTAADDKAYVVPKIISIVVFDTYRDAFTYADMPESDRTRLTEWQNFLKAIANGSVVFETDISEGEDDVAFGIVRTVTRDDQWTSRYGVSDYDE